MSYAAKYASCSSRRSATRSARQFARSADKRTYQMDPAMATKPMREIALDLRKAPTWSWSSREPYLDVLRRVKDAFGCDFRLPGLGRIFDDPRRAERGWLDGGGR